MLSSADDNNQIDFSELHLWNMDSRESHGGFHMPGHVSGRFFSEEYCTRLVATDTTELMETDDLHEPQGPVDKALIAIAEAYHAKESFFVSSGSSTGIHVMLASVMSKQSFLLLPRTIHMSVLHILQILDCKYAFIELPDACELGLPFAQMPEVALRRALDLFPQATDILITSPDYYGQCADLERICELAHDRGCHVLVDEAHGAHFPFSDLCPKNAMQSGADISVTSLHKTIPALTMASLIHVSEEAIRTGRVSSNRIFDMLCRFETSSPSFLIAASSEYAVKYMAQFGKEMIKERIVELDYFRSELRKYPTVCKIETRDIGRRDPLRIVIDFSDSKCMTAFAFFLAMNQEGISGEFCDISRVILIVSIWNQRCDFDNLLKVIRGCAEAKKPLTDEYRIHMKEVDRRFGQAISSAREAVIMSREAVFGGLRTEDIPVFEAADRICAQEIIPYPPGIPLVWPGEKITNADVDLLTDLGEYHIGIRGMHNNKVKVFCNYGNK